MDDPTNPAAPPWSASPTAKAKHAVQRTVTAFLDELAPERELKRVERLPGVVERHRTPTGCVLQAEDAALTVSWFSDPSDEAVLGELHVLVWRGTVTRRGVAKNRKGATLISELILRPVDPGGDGAIWESTDGKRYDTAGLVAKCLALLEEQISAG